MYQSCWNASSRCVAGRGVKDWMKKSSKLLSLPSRLFQPVVCRPNINVCHFSLLKKEEGRIHTELLSAILCLVARSGTLIAYSPSLLRKHCWEIFRSSWNHQQCLKTCQFNSCVLLGPRWKKGKCVVYIIVGAFVGLPSQPPPMVLIICLWSAVYLPSSNPSAASDSRGNQNV